MTKRSVGRIVTVSISAILLLAGVPSAVLGAADRAPWTISAMGGWLDVEGDEPVSDAGLYSLGIGYDLSPRWTLEGIVEVCPQMNSSYRHDWATGERISRLSEDSGRDLAETSAIRFSVDGLLHLAPQQDLDPYLAAGVGVVAYEDDFDSQYEPVIRAGAGLLANLSDRMALRLDCRAVVAGYDTEFNLITTAGLVYRFGSAEGHPSGVSVAVPVLETVRKFVLNLNFDPGQWTIKPEYRAELDMIGRLLDTKNTATARIEGHEEAAGAADAEGTAQQLSEKRAEAVLNYLKDSWKIRGSRMNAAGFGSTRPVAGSTQPSQRIEVYVTFRD